MKYFIPILIIAALFGCRTIKEVTKTVTLIDSSSVAQRDSLIEVNQEMKTRHEAELREAQFSSVVFDTVTLPGDTVRNTIVIRADGSIEAAGRIKAANVSKEKVYKALTELQVKYDSLSQVKNKVETKVVTNTVTKDKYVKRGVAWWIWVLVLLAGALIGYYGGNWLMTRFFKFF